MRRKQTALTPAYRCEFCGKLTRTRLPDGGYVIVRTPPPGRKRICIDCFRLREHGREYMEAMRNAPNEFAARNMHDAYSGRKRT